MKIHGWMFQPVILVVSFREGGCSTLGRFGSNGGGFNSSEQYWSNGIIYIYIHIYDISITYPNKG